MSNNNSILIVGIAAAVLLCGAAAGIAIACMNNDTAMTDEQLYLKGYADGCEAANAADAELQLGAARVASSSDEPMAPYEFGYMTGYSRTMMEKDGMLNSVSVGADPSTYEYYLEYLDWFNGNQRNYKLAEPVAEAQPVLKEMKTQLDSMSYKEVA